MPNIGKIGWKLREHIWFEIKFMDGSASHCISSADSVSSGLTNASHPCRSHSQCMTLYDNMIITVSQASKLHVQYYINRQGFHKNSWDTTICVKFLRNILVHHTNFIKSKTTFQPAWDYYGGPEGSSLHKFFITLNKFWLVWKKYYVIMYT